MYQTLLVSGMEQSWLQAFSTLANAQAYITGLDQSQTYSIIYVDSSTGAITVLQ